MRIRGRLDRAMSRHAGEVAAGEVEAGDGVGDGEGAAETVGDHCAQFVGEARIGGRPTPVARFPR